MAPRGPGRPNEHPTAATLSPFDSASLDGGIKRESTRGPFFARSAGNLEAMRESLIGPPGLNYPIKSPNLGIGPNDRQSEIRLTD